MKVCTKCKKPKPITEFGIDRQKSNGLTPQCKTCRLLSGYKWAARHPERAAQYNLRYRTKHPEKRKASRKAWNARNPEMVKMWRREWARENILKVLAMNRNAKARRKGAQGRHNSADIERLLSMQRRRCAACSTDLRPGFHVDHILAVARGGSNDPSNLQLLCKTCNLKKGARDPIVFFQSIGRLL